MTSTFTEALSNYINMPRVASKREAVDKLSELMEGEEYVDNIRFGIVGDPDSMKEYNSRLKVGCCGYFDMYLIVGGQIALVGCNYGH